MKPLTPFQQLVIDAVRAGNSTMVEVERYLRDHGQTFASLSGNAWRTRKVLIDRGLITVSPAGRMSAADQSKRRYMIPVADLLRDRNNFTFCTIPKWAKWAEVDASNHVTRWAKSING